MNRETVISKKNGRVTLVVRAEIETDPDLSHLGTYSETWQEGAIETNAGPGHYTYFIPAGLDNYAGMPADEIAAYCQRDYERMTAYNRGDWCMLGIVAQVQIDGHVVGSDSVWGVESDAEDYIRELAHETGREAIMRAREFARSLAPAPQPVHDIVVTIEGGLVRDTFMDGRPTADALVISLERDDSYWPEMADHLINVIQGLEIEPETRAEWIEHIDSRREPERATK